MHRELRRKGVTLRLLWEEYVAAHQGAAVYGYTQFCHTVILPARPGRPQDKAKVEAGVLLVRRVGEAERAEAPLRPAERQSHGWLWPVPQAEPEA